MGREFKGHWWDWDSACCKQSAMRKMQMSHSLSCKMLNGDCHPLYMDFSFPRLRIVAHIGNTMQY